MQIGADGQIIGSLLYLVGIGSWLNGPTNETDSRVGWALIVGIVGKINKIRNGKNNKKKCVV